MDIASIVLISAVGLCGLLVLTIEGFLCCTLHYMTLHDTDIVDDYEPIDYDI